MDFTFRDEFAGAARFQRITLSARRLAGNKMQSSDRGIPFFNLDEKWLRQNAACPRPNLHWVFAFGSAPATLANKRSFCNLKKGTALNRAKPALPQKLDAPEPQFDNLCQVISFRSCSKKTTTTPSASPRPNYWHVKGLP